MFKIVHYGETNVGRERKNNEDAFRVAADAGVYLVCDGMGGHASGEIASQIAADAVVRFLAMDRFRPDFRWPAESGVQQSEEARALDAAVRAANREVFVQAQANPLHKGMGTTIAGVYAGAQRLGLVHVGDSRIYRLRDGEFEQLTDDHSLLNYYMNTRPMSAQQIKGFAGKNVIVRAVGLRENVEPDVQITEYRAGDVYLLCSDGLNDMVEDEQIAQILRDGMGDLPQVGARLIQQALDSGGKDNVTILLLKTVEVADQPKAVPFHRRTLPMSPLTSFDTSPGTALDDLEHEPDVAGEGLIDQETMPEIRVNLPPKFAATQPVRPMSREDLTPPAGVPLVVRRATSSQEPTEKIPRDIGAQVRAAQAASLAAAQATTPPLGAAQPTASPNVRDTDPVRAVASAPAGSRSLDEDTDPRGIAPVVVVVRDGRTAGVGADGEWVGATTADLPDLPHLRPPPALASSQPLPALDLGEDLDGPTLPARAVVPPRGEDTADPAIDGPTEPR
ncbi:MAG: serine/threonine-protein phosphatase [Deltaproteobacteria bacterium]|nr:serine/threonine-protein phosphatase [Deltaproteobacteria bacterium]